MRGNRTARVISRTGLRFSAALGAEPGVEVALA